MLDAIARMARIVEIVEIVSECWKQRPRPKVVEFVVFLSAAMYLSEKAIPTCSFEIVADVRSKSTVSSGHGRARPGAKKPRHGINYLSFSRIRSFNLSIRGL
jgi:hypothetical protein